MLDVDPASLLRQLQRFPDPRRRQGRRPARRNQVSAARRRPLKCRVPAKNVGTQTAGTAYAMTQGVDIRSDMAQRIVERVGANVDRTVSVADPQGLVLASTNQAVVHTYLLPNEHSSGAAVAATDDDSECRHVLPLVYADQLVGTLVLEATPASDHQMAGMAKMLAELIVHQMVVIEELPRQARLRDQFVGDLVRGRLRDADPLVEQTAAVLGIDLDLPRVVAVMDVGLLPTSSRNPQQATSSLPSVTRALRLEQGHVNLVDHARRIIAHHAEDVYAFVGEHRFVLLAVADEPFATTHQRVALRVRSFLHALESDQYVPSAGVGHYYSAWTGLTRSWVDAAFALETGTRLHGAGGAYCRDDLGLADFIWHPERATKAERGRRLLATMNDDEDLLATLQIFLAADLSPSAAAEQLHIHRHTLTYRLNKIHRLTGLDPCTFLDAVQLHAALLLRRIDRSAT
ncbi:MAG: helix-turn-helix domain-containing protein [Herpetosiphonaceae bacterium]|nr:helix-turn-helix domain-containing protein [Herpetosiphonaceae bacterium]